jgi:hypothetical protein
MSYNTIQAPMGPTQPYGQPVNYIGPPQGGGEVLESYHVPPNAFQPQDIMVQK